MKTKILDGKLVRDAIAAQLTREIVSFKTRPTLAIIQVGNLSESNIYIEQKKKLGEKIGCNVLHVKYLDSIETQDLVVEVQKLNQDKNVNGIIVQLPLPQTIHLHTVLESIDPRKDIDGLTSTNLKLLWDREEGGFVPATAKGIVSLLDYYKIKIEGKRVVVVGRSNLVGKPTALVFLGRNATVTIAHRKTLDLPSETRRAEILVVAAGSARLIGKEHVREGQVVIDVGINTALRRENPDQSRTFVGDVDAESVEGIIAALTEVPGGVGPMTVVSLFQNLIAAYRRQTSPQ